MCKKNNTRAYDNANYYSADSGIIPCMYHCWDWKLEIASLKKMLWNYRDGVQPRLGSHLPLPLELTVVEYMAQILTDEHSEQWYHKSELFLLYAFYF